ncbi:hypothetical protein E2C01_026991 [Portunus trituberculatus]|uniref:Uncharacterized protein n=1 Tax=Portunus trituberculatus TaxID=210409 RepID=A0A5B7EKD4_PORTR|nr:hypothetical protein [Portunus trituberculatus]
MQPSHLHHSICPSSRGGDEVTLGLPHLPTHLCSIALPVTPPPSRQASSGGRLARHILHTLPQIRLRP